MMDVKETAFVAAGPVMCHDKGLMLYFYSSYAGIQQETADGDRRALPNLSNNTRFPSLAA